MISVAPVIPILCMANEKLRAAAGGIFNNKVKTGYETAALPSGLEPATKEPNIMVSIAFHLSAINWRFGNCNTYISQPVIMQNKNTRYNTGTRRLYSVALLMLWKYKIYNVHFALNFKTIFLPPKFFLSSKHFKMDNVLKNQESILGNQETIKDNQGNIVENQDTIKENQAHILNNQETIKENQENIQKNQDHILANQKSLDKIIKIQQEILSLLKK